MKCAQVLLGLVRSMRHNPQSQLCLPVKSAGPAVRLLSDRVDVNTDRQSKNSCDEVPHTTATLRGVQQL